VGPAIIRHVIVTVDGQPVTNWEQALQKILGPGIHHFSESSMNGHVLSAGESMQICTPADANGKPITVDKSNPVSINMDKARARVGIEICYCSTLGGCWTLRSGAMGGSTTTAETRRCPNQSATSFQQ
jgi:hypothetical protein